jgi:transformation/transcription domain-associated protein
VSRGESCVWVEQWVHCSAQLGHWDTLLDYSRGVDNHELSIDCMWKLSDWGGLKEILSTKALVDDNVKTLTTRAFLALQDGDSQSCDTRMQQAISTALNRWWQLPEHVLNARLPLLQSFQQLVELKESCKIFLDLQLGNSRPNHPFKDMREIMESWRLRQPNEYEQLSGWQDLLMWRNQVHNLVVTAFNNVAFEGTSQLNQLGYKEKAWTVNRLASVFTLHGCTDSTLNTLT